MGRVKVWANKCERCGYVWLPRTGSKPKVCPNKRCKSLYWDRPRLRSIAEGEGKM